ncbi:uncharacterized protein N7525_010617 [Penicillium rubens]|uniref:uncharacterized protein n=1 Tax=Penicillium rubens TaxID=1108849 RepID=UPI002A5A14FC|nr:uncharacterized protein N7525_010617 [Penicillium rubens]KAJ5821333.1 hypothetical protein N7525_010617 [Penicillium rubens]
MGTPTDDPSSTTSTTAASTTITQSPTTTETAPSNSPTMLGIVGSCDGFHKVSSGDHMVSSPSLVLFCYIIGTEFQGSILQNLDLTFIQCTNFWLDYYICPTPEPSGPTPQMPGIVSNCKSFHLIKDGDSCWSCWSINTDAGITLT